MPNTMPCSNKGCREAAVRRTKTPGNGVKSVNDVKATVLEPQADKAPLTQLGHYSCYCTAVWLTSFSTTSRETTQASPCRNPFSSTEQLPLRNLSGHSAGPPLPLLLPGKMGQLAMRHVTFSFCLSAAVTAVDRRDRRLGVIEDVSLGP